MVRTLLIAASLIGATAPTLAEAPISATSGALAGRSPHALYIAADAGEARCGKTMHSIPAGKPHSYGSHALAKPCQPLELASAAPAGTPAAD